MTLGCWNAEGKFFAKCVNCGPVQLIMQLYCRSLISTQRLCQGAKWHMINSYCKVYFQVSIQEEKGCDLSKFCSWADWNIPTSEEKLECKLTWLIRLWTMALGNKAEDLCTHLWLYAFILRGTGSQDCWVNSWVNSIMSVWVILNIRINKGVSLHGHINKYEHEWYIAVMSKTPVSHN